MQAFVQTYSQTRARLMFVTTLEMDNFDCTKMNARFQKFTACLQEGLIHEWKQALLAPPLPLMSLNNSRLCSTHSHRTAPLAWLLPLLSGESLGTRLASRHKLVFTSKHYTLLTATDTTALYKTPFCVFFIIFFF